MLNIVTFLWGSKYDITYVQKLVAGIRRNLKQDHRIFLCTDDLYREGIQGKGTGTFWIDGCYGGTVVPIIRDLPLLEVKGCFARLRLFDPAWQTDRGWFNGDRVVSIDLDAVITGPLDPLFDRKEPFVILQGANTANPCPFNGSVWMFRVGHHPEIWDDFSLDAASRVPFYEFPDDQGWFWHKIPDAAGWVAGADSGVYAFQKNGWPKGDDLPDGARLVAFPGWRDPSKFSHLSWMKESWRD